MKKLLLLLLLLYPMTAAAETYQWTDESGTVNFSEDLGKVPKKFRKKARKLGGEEGEAPAAVSNSPQAAPPKADARSEKKLYGGRDEAAWRRDFGQARANLESAETELAALKGRLGDTSKMSRSEYLAIQNSVKHGETRVKELQRRLDLLKEAADRNDVPPEFRQTK